MYVGAFRPASRDPQTLLFFSDQAWLIFVGMWSAASMQSLCIGLAALRDRHPVPIIPRAYGYFNVWVATLFVPGGLIYFFKSGRSAGTARSRSGCRRRLARRRSATAGVGRVSPRPGYGAPDPAPPCSM
jgi:hypothetical protein